MASQPTPDLLQALFDLRNRLDVAAHGQATQLVHSWAALHGKRPNTVYRWLKTHADYASGRKRRADAGKTALTDAALQFVASARKESVRGNGKVTLPTSVALSIARQNGIDVPVCANRVNALMRQQRMDIKSQQAARSHTTLRSLHPNHVHEIDPSLCLLYYAPEGGQRILRDEEIYKNKPHGLDKAKLKVWRYVRYDHASGVIDVRYFEAAGENQQALFEFLLWTWGRQEGRVSYGVPRMLLWDKGSANTSKAVCNLLDALGVQHQTHAPGHAWAKGGVEQANNLVETQFESRLRFEPVQSVEALNDAAQRWQRDYNANVIPKSDSRIRRHSGEPFIRDALWQSILQHPGALVEMPERQVCQWFMAGHEQSRIVRDLGISFAHPELGRSARYDLTDWAEFVGNGQKVCITPLLLQGGALRVAIERFGQEPLLVQLAPQTAFDDYGRPLDAPILGQEYKRAPASAPERAANALAVAAWGHGTTQEGAEALRAKQAKPFAAANNGKGLQAHSQLGRGELPTRLLPAAAAVQTDQIDRLRAQTRSVQILLSVPEAVRAVQAQLGDAAPMDLYAQAKAAHPSGKVPQDWVDALVQQSQKRATGTHGAALRIVK